MPGCYCVFHKCFYCTNIRHQEKHIINIFVSDNKFSNIILEWSDGKKEDIRLYTICNFIHRWATHPKNIIQHQIIDNIRDFRTVCLYFDGVYIVAPPDQIIINAYEWWFDFIIKNVMPKLRIYNSEVAVNNANIYITTLRYELNNILRQNTEIKELERIENERKELERIENERKELEQLKINAFNIYSTFGEKKIKNNALLQLYEEAYMIIRNNIAEELIKQYIQNIKQYMEHINNNETYIEHICKISQEQHKIKNAQLNIYYTISKLENIIETIKQSDEYKNSNNICTICNTLFDEIPEDIKQPDIINETIVDYITYIFWKDYGMHIPHIIPACCGIMPICLSCALFTVPNTPFGYCPNQQMEHNNIMEQLERARIIASEE